MPEFARDIDGMISLFTGFNIVAICLFALLALAEAFLLLRVKRAGHAAAAPFGRGVAHLSAGVEDAAKRHEKLLIICITGFALFVRLFLIGRYPMGFNQDEASIAYDAWCMANYGTDRYGYTNPVYLVAWGSGQNALYMYLLVPLYKLFGFSVAITRLPQALLGGIAPFLLYLALRKAGGRRVALIGAALLAACPWHLMASRWALEVYPLIPMLLGGMACILYANTRPWLWLPAFALFALCLYCYITSVIFLAVFLAPAFILLMIAKKIRWRWFLPGAALGLVVALPLLLFVLVNNGVMGEIRTGLFSVPLIPGYRDGELGADTQTSVQQLPIYFLMQQPHWFNTLFDHVPVFGVVYLFSAPFILAGLLWLLWQVVQSVRGRSPQPQLLWLCWLIGGVATSVLVYPKTFNRSMTLAMALVVLAAFGLAAATRWLQTLRLAAVPVYAAGFCLFLVMYFVSYAPAIGQTFYRYLPETFTFADEVAGQKDIVVSSNINPAFDAMSVWPLICLNRELSPEAFQAQFETARKNAEYGPHTNLANYYLLGKELDSAARYDPSKVYVLFIHEDPVEEYRALGFEVEVIDAFAVAWQPQQAKK